MKSTRCALLTGALAAALAASGCSKAGESQGAGEAAAAPSPTAAAEPEVAKAAEPAAAGAEVAAPGETEETAAEETEAAAAADIAAGAPSAGQAAARGARAAAKGAAGAETLADTDTYTVRVERPATAAQGEASRVALHVSPKPGWKLNLEFPTKLTIAPPDGVEVAKATQKVADAAKFEEQGAVFQVDFTAADPGSKQFTADFKFAVCTESTCDPKKQALAWAVDVK